MEANTGPLGRTGGHVWRGGVPHKDDGSDFYVRCIPANNVEGMFFEAHVFIHIFDVVMYAFLAIGVSAVYLRQKGWAGTLGMTGYLLTFARFSTAVVAGLAIIVVGLAVSNDATQVILDVLAHPIPQLLYTIGMITFGIAIVRADVLPRLGGILLLVGSPVPFASGVAVSAMDGPLVWLALIPAMFYASSWAFLGFTLYAEQNQAADSGQAAAFARPT